MMILAGVGKAGGLVLALGGVGGVAFAQHVKRRLWQERRSHDVEVTETELCMGDAAPIPRSAIRRAVAVPGQEPFVRITLGGIAAPLELVTPDLDEARKLVDALGFGPDDRTLSFRARGPAWKWPMGAAMALTLSSMAIGFIVAMAKTHPDISFAVAGVAVPLVTLFVFGLLWPARLTVGADGIELAWLGMRRFVGYGDVEDVTPFQERRGKSRLAGLRLRLSKGGTETVILGRAETDENVISALQRLREAMATWRQGAQPAGAALLEPNGRSARDWLHDLRAAAVDASTFRNTALARDTLWRIAEDGAAPTLARAGAAVTLATELQDPEEGARLRAVASSSANPRLRILVERVIDDSDEDRLVDALAELEEDERSAARS
jgi:hypothetical protein